MFLVTRSSIAQSGTVVSVALLEITTNACGRSQSLLVLDRDKRVGHNVV